MKRKLLLGLIVVITLFMVGCKSTKEVKKENLHKAEFGDMRYNEPKNYAKKDPYDLGKGNKVINYTFTEDENKHINLYLYSGKKQNTYIDSSDNVEDKSINGYKWSVIHAKDSTGEYDTCYFEYNGNLYAIELNGTEKYQKEFDEFMEGITFE